MSGLETVDGPALKHKFVEHKNCTNDYCAICEGGLALCEVCNGFEGSLTTECCGEKVPEAKLKQVYEGVLDFKNGRWVSIGVQS